MTSDDDRRAPSTRCTGRPPADGTPIIEVQEIGKRYGNIIALSRRHDLGPGR